MAGTPKGEASAPAAEKKKRKSKAKVPNVDILQQEPKRPSQAVIDKAKSSNPPRVRWVGLNYTGDNLAVLGGYIGIAETPLVRDFLDEAYNKTYIQSWIDSRSKGFGVDGRDATTPWSTKTLFDFIYSPPAELVGNLTASLPLSTADFPTNQVARGYASWIVTMYQMMQDFPKHFPVADNPETTSDYVITGQVGAENWYRACMILRTIWRIHSPSREALSQQDSTAASKRQTRASVPAYYLTDEDYRAVIDAEGGELSAGTDALRQYLADEVDFAAIVHLTDEEHEDGDDDGNKKRAMDGDTLEDELDKKIAATKIKNEAGFPALDQAAQRELITSIASRVTYLYGHPATKFSEKDTVALGVKDSEGGMIESTVINRAEAEGNVTGTSADMPDQTRQEFWTLQRQMNQTSSLTKPYEECCIDLGLAAHSPTVGDITLRPWQVTGVWWLLFQWGHGLGSGVLGDDVGLGKTITSICAVILGVQLAVTPNAAAQIDLGLRGPYAPTVILCPGSAFNVWKKECELFASLGLTVYIWAGSASKNEVANRHLTLGTDAESLAEFCKQFDPADPRTALNLVLTTLPTFHTRTLTFAHDAKREPKTRIKSDELDDDGEDEAELNDEEVRALTAKVKGCFGVGLLDEAHLVKSVRTRTHQAVLLAVIKHLAFITATITINRVSDLYGPLSLIKAHLPPELKSVGEDPDADDEPEDEDSSTTLLTRWQAKRDALGWSKLPAVNLLPFEKVLFFIQPTTFRRLLNSDNSGRDTVSINAIILPLVLGFIQLRRVKGQLMIVNGEEMVIGADIPMYRIVTIELEQGIEEARMYAEEYKETIMGRTTKLSDDLIQVPKILDMTRHRRMCQATLHPMLPRLGRRKTYTTKKLATWSDRDDYGYTFWHRTTKTETAQPPYRDRVAAAVSLSANSVKLQCLAGLVKEICLDENQNVIIFCQWPSTQWLVELFLYLLGIPTLSIRAAHTRKARGVTEALLNDPKTKGTALVTGVRCASTSLNLQYNASRIIFMEAFLKANEKGQAVGRVHRMGQKNFQVIYQLFTRWSYDGIQEGRAARKMYDQIAGTSAIVITQEEIDAARAELKAEKGKDGDADTDMDDGPNNTIEESAISRVRLRKVVQIYMYIYGQRAYTHTINNLASPMECGAAEKDATVAVHPSARIRQIYTKLTTEIRKWERKGRLPISDAKAAKGTASRIPPSTDPKVPKTAALNKSDSSDPHAAKATTPNELGSSKPNAVGGTTTAKLTKSAPKNKASSSGTPAKEVPKLPPGVAAATRPSSRTTRSVKRKELLDELPDELPDEANDSPRGDNNPPAKKTKLILKVGHSLPSSNNGMTEPQGIATKEAGSKLTTSGEGMDADSTDDKMDGS